MTATALYARCNAFARHQLRRHVSLVDDCAAAGAAGLGLAVALRRHDPSRASLASFAFTQVRGQVTQAVRRARRYRQHHTELPDEPHQASGPSVETRLAVRQGLSCLPERLRATVVLRHVEGMTVSEVATRLGRSRATVHRDLRAATERLRRSLG